MLGREAIGDLARLLDVRCNNHNAIARQELRARPRFARLRAFASAITSCASSRARGDEDRQGLGIVLRLRDQVGGNLGGAPRSLVTTISVGPASMSMAQSNATSRLAAVT